MNILKSNPPTFERIISLSVLPLTCTSRLRIYIYPITYYRLGLNPFINLFNYPPILLKPIFVYSYAPGSYLRLTVWHFFVMYCILILAILDLYDKYLFDLFVYNIYVLSVAEFKFDMGLRTSPLPSYKYIFSNFLMHNVYKYKIWLDYCSFIA